MQLIYIRYSSAKEYVQSVHFNLAFCARYKIQIPAICVIDRTRVWLTMELVTDVSKTHALHVALQILLNARNVIKG